MREIIPIKQIGQTCGQVCVAMYSGISEEEAIKIIGQKKGTWGKQLIAGLEKLKVKCSNKTLRFKGLYPFAAILGLRAKKGFKRTREDGTAWHGHWLLLYNSVIYDPAKGVSINLKTFTEWMETENYRFTSYIEILEDN